jgi:7,8-dihydroneopterin aldolase/epimerase/oxygenase
MSSDCIRIQNMHFYGYHGVDRSERELGGRFAIDVELHRDLSEAGRTDDLTKTVDYKAVYDLVNKIQGEQAFNLLEALAETVAAEILARFDLEEVVVRARKQSVPLGGLIEYTEVEIRRGPLR